MEIVSSIKFLGHDWFSKLSFFLSSSFLRENLLFSESYYEVITYYPKNRQLLEKEKAPDVIFFQG